MEFEITKKSKKSRARLGVIKTAHGVLHTPAFFPVATKATVKTLTSQDIKEIGFEGILANTYHLHLQPGEKIIKKMGGLHKFMDFNGVIATDSGGFQVFSLGKGISHNTSKFAKSDTASDDRPILYQRPLVKITEQGVYFKSHLDGSGQFLSPEKSIQIQQDLGADIIFAFDECTSPKETQEYTKKAMERTHRWAIRCLQAANSPNSKCKNQNAKLNLKIKNCEKQGLFGIIQGGKYKKLRKQSAKFIGNLDFDGFGIGGSFGSSYGDSKKNLFEVLNLTIPLLLQEKPRHLLGIGHLEDLEKAIKSGIDLFDCVHPTRVARHGVALTSQGEINITKAVFSKNKSPLDKKCACPTCQNHSKAYLCHLLRAGEITGMRLLTFHNLWSFKQFIDNIRKKVENNKI
ncbi:MAG: tRNA guanosine(34) transglycosylase Tgt [Candidatus Pacebacteria bacterium]|nr:tRNA guanosine(34) transglycosylase Tgt [Candidatus Paceibacterota bacterium]